jgi:hypothetical protein
MKKLIAIISLLILGAVSYSFWSFKTGEVEIVLYDIIPLLTGEMTVDVSVPETETEIESEIVGEENVISETKMGSEGEIGSDDLIEDNMIVATVDWIDIVTLADD